MRYQALIRQALGDIRIDPERPGSKTYPYSILDGVRTYHIANNRSEIAGERVKTPRRLVLYRVRADGVIEVARVLHDSTDLPRHLPSEYLS